MKSVVLFCAFLCGSLLAGIPVPSFDVQGRIDAAAAAGGGAVTVPPGDWEARPFAFRSNVTLELSEGTVLSASTNLQDYAAQMRGNRHFILAEGVTNVSIRGRGVLVGNGWAFCESKRLSGESQPQDLPVMMRFSRCRDVRLEGFSYRDCGAWGLHLRNCDGVTVRRLTCFSHSNRTNDGIDIESSNVVVEDCDFDTGDDAVVFKTESDRTFPVTNVVVRNCRIASHCNGIKFGTGSYGDVRDIVIENCALRRASPHRKPCDWRAFPGVEEEVVGLSGLALEVVDGGRMENVTIRDLDIGGFMVPVFVRLGRRRPPFSEKGSYLRNVLIENVRGVADSRIASSITGVPGLRPSGITLRNIELACRGGGTKADAVRPVPEMEKAYPECIMFHRGWPDGLVPDDLVLPAWGLYVRHADDIRLENVRLTLREPDARQDIVTDDCKGFVRRNEL